jgi:hypothetical protein
LHRRWARLAGERLCFLVGAVRFDILTAGFSTPGNARGGSDVPGPPYSLTVAVREGNHFDVEMMAYTASGFSRGAR